MQQLSGSGDSKTPDKIAAVVNAARGDIKPLRGDSSDTSKRDDPYANLRYPFQVDSLAAKNRASAVGGGPMVEQIGQKPSLRAGDSVGARTSLTGSTTPQSQNGRAEQELRQPQSPDAREEGSQCTPIPYAHPGGLSKLVGPSMTLEDLIANWRPPVGRHDNSSHNNGVLNETLHAARPNPQGARTVSPILRYRSSNSPPTTFLRMSPPRRSVSQAFNHRADPALTHPRTKSFPRKSWVREAKPAPRAFAPGLAMRKSKIDCYDPLGLALPKQPFLMAADLVEPDVRGTWTTVDKDTNVRGFDRIWHAEKSKDSFATGGRSVGSIGNGVSDMATASSSDTIFYTSEGDKFDGSKESSHEKLDDRFENPDLDVDEDVRKKFLSVKDVLTERTGPISIRDHRNPFLRQSVPSAPMAVIIGGRVSKVLRHEPDRRGEFQDRFGNYVGANLGRMKKHLIEDREMRIKVRDEEMVEATKQKRAFEALGPEERKIALAKKRAPMGFTTGGQGAASGDIFEFSDIPEIYLNSVAESLSTQITRSTPAHQHTVSSPKASATASSVGEKPDALNSNRELSTDDFHPIEEFGDFGLTHKGADQSVYMRRPHQPISISGTLSSTAKATGANTARIGTRKSRGRKIQATISSTEPSGTTPSLFEEDPDLTAIEDIENVLGEFIPGDSEVKADAWTNLVLSSSTRGRVVSVALHDPVLFTPGAVMERIFGGIIQDVQFHPRERIALVVFVFPAEAENFVRHVKAAKENDHQEYRRLQIDVDWYKGSEHHAVYPLQKRTALRVIGEDATRVIGVNGIALQKKKEDVNEELNIYLMKLLVKVGLMLPNKRYVQERDGKMAIIEFASVKDAMEAMRLFKGGLIHGYRNCSVQWLRDSCDKPAVKQPWCSCTTCASS